MKTIIINENDSGQRVDKFLGKFLPDMPKSLLYKALRKKRVKLGKKALAAQDILHTGDELNLYINDEFFTGRRTVPSKDTQAAAVSVAYEDENVLVVCKPVGQTAHDGAGSLLAAVLQYVTQSGAYDPAREHSFVPALSNRLDRNTSGLVLVGKNAAAQRALNEAVKCGAVTKIYLCLAEGHFKEKAGRLENELKSSERENRVSVVPSGTKGAKHAVLTYRVLEEKGDLSRVEVTLLTGRKHQIRVQLAHIGHPLAGDVKYGAPHRAGFRYQALCAYRLDFHDIEEDSVLAYLNGKSVCTEPQLPTIG